jgi:hypothetical protein
MPDCEAIEVIKRQYLEAAEVISTMRVVRIKVEMLGKHSCCKYHEKMHFCGNAKETMKHNSDI